MLVNQVVILVGGKGTRLGQATRDIPKPLLPIEGDTRFLDYLIDHVARQGFTDILLVAGHLGEQVAARYGETTTRHGASLRVICEPAPRGTAGALIEVRDLLAHEFLLMNGDAFVDVNLRAFERAAAALATPAVIASLEVDDPRRYGTLECDGASIRAFREKDAAMTRRAPINAGIYRLSRDVCAEIQQLPASIETDVFPVLAGRQALGHVPVTGWFLDIGLPETLAIARAEMPARMRRPCVFFDRDNTLIVDRGYTHRPQDLQWMPGAPDIIRQCNDAGCAVVVVTNQAGVAKGHYDEAAVVAFHAAMNASLAETGAFIDAFYYCPFHVEGTVERYRRDHEDRKPNPGMIHRAFRDLRIDPARALLVGDSASDVEAAVAAGIPGHLFQGGRLDAFVRDLPGASGVITNG